MNAEDYKQKRKKLGYTQATAAAKLGVFRETIARRETGAVEISSEAWISLCSLPKAKKTKKKK